MLTEPTIRAARNVFLRHNRSMGFRGTKGGYPRLRIRLKKLKIPGRLYFNFAAVLCLVLMALLAGGAARHESVTFDEVAHIAAGVSYLQKLDMRMNEEHPPLAKAIAAVPLALRGAHADYSHISWTFSDKMFYQYLGEWVFGHWFLMKWNEPYPTIFGRERRCC
jgi:hypothetical protein